MNSEEETVVRLGRGGAVLHWGSREGKKEKLTMLKLWGNPTNKIKGFGRKTGMKRDNPQGWKFFFSRLKKKKEGTVRANQVVNPLESVERNRLVEESHSICKTWSSKRGGKRRKIWDLEGKGGTSKWKSSGKKEMGGNREQVEAKGTSKKAEHLELSGKGVNPPLNCV